MGRAVKALVAIGVLGAFLFFWIGSDLERFVNRVEPFALPEASDEARDIHDRSLVVDLHADSLAFGRDLLEESETGHVDLPRLQAGGVGLQVFATVTRTPFGFDIHHTDTYDIDLLTLGFIAQRSPMASFGPLQRAIHQASQLESLIERSEGGLVAISSREDLRALVSRRDKGDAVIGAILGVEGAHALEGDLANLDRLYDAGVRMIGITHFFDNEFAGSTHGIEKGGLTEKGRRLIAQMESRGIAVDLAHLSPAAVDDVLEMAKKPTLISHGGVKGTCDNPRNISDDHVKAIAAGGGLVGIGYFDLAVCGNEPRDVVAAMLHVIDLVGDEHVALGSDYDGGTKVTFDTSQLRSLTQQMLDDGLPPESIRKILGTNALRIFGRTLPPS